MEIQFNFPPEKAHITENEFGKLNNCRKSARKKVTA